MAAVIYAARLFSAEVALGSPLVFYTSPEIETCYPPLICPRDRKDLARGLWVGVARSLSAPSDLRPPCLIEARKHPRVDDVLLLSLNPHTLRLLVDVVGLGVVRVDEAVILAPLVPVARELAPMDCLRRARNIPPEVLPRRCAARNAGATWFPVGLRGQRRKVVGCGDRRLSHPRRPAAAPGSVTRWVLGLIQGL